nr:uncharacterized protein LOC113740252 [Coffea arabica]
MTERHGGCFYRHSWFVSRPLSFSPAMEGTSAARDSGGSTSSRSDSSDYESVAKTHHSHRNFSSRRCFMSKPVHPLTLPSDTPRREATDSNAAGYLEFDACSVDLTDVSEPFEADFSSRYCNPSDSFKCGLCERLLSQRSPWSSRRIVRSGDMPVAGVLSCCHVFHAECLEQTTPKANKNDPPCPICAKVEEENSPDQRVFSKFFPRLRPFCEDGPSRPWGCAQAGDCVEGALHAPSRSTMLSLTRSRIKKNLSLKGNVGRDFPGRRGKVAHLPHSYLLVQLTMESLFVRDSFWHKCEVKPEECV